MSQPQVVDLAKLRRASASIQFGGEIPKASILSPASNFKPSDIGKKFVPPLNLNLRVTAPLVVPQNIPNFTANLYASDIPETFDWRDSKVTKILPPQDQGQCGTCFAVSSSTVLSDQYAIASKIKNPPLLSALAMANCVGDCGRCSSNICGTEPCNGCNNCTCGGQLSSVAEYASVKGIPPTSCYPYNCDDCDINHKNSTSAKCNMPSTDKCPRFFVKPGSVTAGIVVKNGVSPNRITSQNQIDVPATIQLIKKWIYSNGPINLGFLVFPDFMDIPNDPNYIYKTSSNSQQTGGHAVVIVGWGLDAKKQLYWIIRNSWSTGWGDRGYCRVYAYPLNNCGFDIPIVNRNINGDYSLFGGTTLWNIDLARSPKNYSPGMMTALQTQLYTASSSTKHWILFILVIVLALGGYFWYKKSHAAPHSSFTQ